MQRRISHWKTEGLDFSRIFYRPDVDNTTAVYHANAGSWFGARTGSCFDRTGSACSGKQTGRRDQYTYRNVNRTFGAMLSGEVAKRYGHKGLQTIPSQSHVKGTAGQSFGAFLAQGISIELEGEGNDYVGKGMWRRIAIYPPKRLSY